MGIQILSLLNDLICGPNQDNILTLVDSKLVDNIRELLDKQFNIQKYKKKANTDAKDKKVVLLKNKAIEVLTSMVQGNSDNSLLLKISTMIDPDTLRKRMTIIFENYMLSVYNKKYNDKSDIVKLSKDLRIKHVMGVLREGFEI